MTEFPVSRGLPAAVDLDSLFRLLCSLNSPSAHIIPVCAANGLAPPTLRNL